MKNKIIDIISNSGTWQTDNEGREGTWIDKKDINSIAKEIVKNCSIPDVSDFTFEDIVDAVDYGFKYRDESQHDGFVPIGNSLQWLMAKRKMLSIPNQWKRYIEAKRNDR